MKTKIAGIQKGSPVHEVLGKYLAALEARDYQVARVCLMTLLRWLNPLQAADVIRLTHEMEPLA